MNQFLFLSFYKLLPSGYYGVAVMDTVQALSVYRTIDQRCLKTDQALALIKFT